MLSLDLRKKFGWAWTKTLIHPLHKRWNSHAGYNGYLPPSHQVEAITSRDWNLQVAISHEGLDLNAHIAPSWMAPTRGLDWRELWSLAGLPPIDPERQWQGLDDVDDLADSLLLLLECKALPALLREKAATGDAFTNKFPQTRDDLRAVRTLYIEDPSVNFGAFVDCHDHYVRPLLEEQGYVQGPATVWAGGLWSLNYYSPKGSLRHSLDTRYRVAGMTFRFRDYAGGKTLFMNQIAKALGRPICAEQYFKASEFQAAVAGVGAYLREHFTDILAAGRPDLSRRARCNSTRP